MWARDDEGDLSPSAFVVPKVSLGASNADGFVAAKHGVAARV